MVEKSQFAVRYKEVRGRETGLGHLLSSSCEQQYSELGGGKSAKEAVCSWNELAQAVAGTLRDLSHCHRLART